jgi:hypothetical protein
MTPAHRTVIDGAIGDGSQFHATFGVCAHGVGPETAVAPSGWQERLIRVDAPPAVASRPARSGWCLEPHDLMLAKLAAGRERDWDFVEAAVRHGLVHVRILRERSELMPDSHRDLVRPRLNGRDHTRRALMRVPATSSHPENRTFPADHTPLGSLPPQR